MVICSSISEISRQLENHPRFKMAPRPHSLSNYKENPAILTKTHSTASSKNGFRLQSPIDLPLPQPQDDSGSVYSVYKQKIDAMFQDRSPLSSMKEQINNSVQARIEKMFTDISKDVDQRLSEISQVRHSFSIDYLGSIPLVDKVTSLIGLQDPLRELYFAYRKNLKKKILTGRLEISNSGLKVCYQGDKGDLEQLNPFPTIAVWSAVKFVVNNDATEYAFVPLITDPDNFPKQFRTLDPQDAKYIIRTDGSQQHSPLFAVVMRKIGVQKQLECHGFVCQTSEDAIVIAATLYKSLMAFMKKPSSSSVSTRPKMRPKNRNGISCMSIASTTANDVGNYMEITPTVPVRPPRKKRSGSTASSIVSVGSYRNRSSNVPKSKRSGPKAPDPIEVPSRNNHLDLDAIIPYSSSKDLEMYKRGGNNKSHDSLIRDFNQSQQSSLYDWQQKQDAQKNTTSSTDAVTQSRGFERAQSLRKSDRTSAAENNGDILTKVTIPRSGSFLNAKGLTKYKSTTSRSNGQQSGGSPLGFHELFNEFRVQEGLNSLDEILSAIIDSEGMSFNDLKPIYKEFLLKLALTLTKDELYQRSKTIMRRQKKKLLRRNSSNQNKRKKVLLGAKGLKRVFRRSFSVRFSKKIKKQPVVVKPPKELVTIEHSSGISMSSFDTKQFQPKKLASIATRSGSYRGKQDLMVSSTSEESDFFSLQRKGKVERRGQNCGQNRNSSSGYVSCSECSYDSDSCTCVSADKCYCTLGPQKPQNVNTCKSEDKCYCSLEKSSKCLGNGTDKCYCSLENTKKCQRTPSQRTVENMFYHSITEKKTHQHSSQVHKYYNDLAALQQKFGVQRPNRKKCQCGSPSAVWCGCDTDSCTDSNKCYCYSNLNTQTKTPSILEQLKERGFMADDEQHHLPRHPSSNKVSKSTKSLEYLHSPEEQFYDQKIKKEKSGSKRSEGKRCYSSDNLGLDYELFTVESDGKRKNGLSGRKGRGSTASECGGFKSVFRATDSIRSYNSQQNYTTHSSGRGSHGGGSNTEALSVKKSAEIAALFADVKLSQTTDITHLMTSEQLKYKLPPLPPLPPPSSSALNARISSHLEQQRKELMEQQKLNHREIFANSYQTTSGSISSRASSRSKSMLKTGECMPPKLMSPANLFSANNGLYTIQSQSDDSRQSRSSKGMPEKKEYVPLHKTNSSISNNIENSLGYLP